MSTSASISVLDAIRQRRAVRDFKPESVSKEQVQQLLAAAVDAPTARHEEPWAFVVIQDKALLERLSDHVKLLLGAGGDPMHPGSAGHPSGPFMAPAFNAFYNASTLILICGKPMGAFVVSDCWLAAENLMLAAYAIGLGSCVIGLAVAELNTPAWKLQLGIGADTTVYAPIIVGIPAGHTPPVPRKPPEILAWK